MVCDWNLSGWRMEDEWDGGGVTGGWMGENLMSRGD